MKPVVLSVFHIHPARIDGTAMFARALSAQISAQGLQSVLCFPSAPSPAVREFFAGACAWVDVEPEVFDSRFTVSARAFCRLMKRYNPGIVHLHFMGFISAFPWLARVHGVSKIFFTDHSSRRESAPEGPGSLFKRLAAFAINHPLHRVIAVSEYSLGSLVALRQGPRQRFHVIYNGVDLERVAVAGGRARQFRERFGIPAESTLITQLSWLIPEKGVLDLLEAARAVLKACPWCHFLISGAGPDLDDYKKMARDSGIAAHCTFTGELTNPFFDGVFSASDIVCQPSRWQEAFCWVVAEAMAFSRPVVATSVGALPEVVRDRVTGYLVAGRDVEELATRLIELASDDALRERMGAAGHEAVIARFSLDRNISEHMRLYELPQLAG